MIKIEAETLEKAYENAASALHCSVTELATEVVQHPSSGYLGMFKKSAIIVAVKEIKNGVTAPQIDIHIKETEQIELSHEKERVHTSEKVKEAVVSKKESLISPKLKVKQVKSAIHNIFTQTNISSLISKEIEQHEEDKVLESSDNFTADSKGNSDEKSETDENFLNINKIVKSVNEEINSFFGLTCFEIDKIQVSAYNHETLLIEFKGKDAALLIGKEGYRYKAISYMLFNWINSKYKVQLRLEIAEFLKNQEESVARYIETVCESIDREGRAQTKILDGVLVQIALKELRDRYPDKYVVIRSTRDGLKYIIINDYHSS